MDILGFIAAIILAVLTYIFGRRESTSRVRKNDAESNKLKEESARISTDNRMAEIEAFNKINRSLLEQNERLLKSNDRLVATNETLIAQNKKLLKQVGALEERLDALERQACVNAPNCENKKPLN